MAVIVYCFVVGDELLLTRTRSRTSSTSSSVAYHHKHTTVQWTFSCWTWATKFLFSTLPNKKSWDDQRMFCTCWMPLLSDRNGIWPCRTCHQQCQSTEETRSTDTTQVHSPTSLVICCYWQVYFFNMSCLGVVILQVGAVMACLYRRMVRMHTHSLTYHVFARVVSRCLPCGFRLPECPPMAGPP